MEITLIVLISYIIGSLSPAYIIGKIQEDLDVRQHGSGNAGTTNVYRVLGLKAAVITFVLDFLKGLIAVIIGRKILGYNGALLASVLVVIGHNYPIFLKFKGGKGIATSIGVLCALNWKVGLGSTILGASIAFSTKYVSLGSILGTISAPIFFYIFDKFDGNLRIAVLILVGSSLIRHRSNILRLIKGVENKI